MPNLVIRREVGWEQKTTLYTILVDGVEAGTVRQGEQVKVPVQPGRRSVQFRMGKCSSRPLELSVAPEKDELIEGSHPTKALPSMLRRLLFPSSFIRARRLTTGFTSIHGK